LGKYQGEKEDFLDVVLAERRKEDEEISW